MDHGKAWEATIARSLPSYAIYERIPDAGPAARAAAQSGLAIRFAAARPYDARIDWWPGRSCAIEAKSTAGIAYAPPKKTRKQIAAMAEAHLICGVPRLLLLELRGAPEPERWWWATAPAIAVHWSNRKRFTLRAADLRELGGQPIPRAKRGKTKTYLDLEPMLRDLAGMGKALDGLRVSR